MAAVEGGGGGPRSVSILGSTGSVGRSTIDLVRHHPGSYRVEALTAHRSVGLLAEQARSLGAACAVIGDESLYGELRSRLAGSGVEAAAGCDAVAAAAARPVDWTMAAIVGAAGLVPTFEAIRQGGVVALANKESLVCAGDLMLSAVADSGARLLPVDSEHNAIFQVVDGTCGQGVERIILTTSGGPFRDAPVSSMRAAGPAQAVAHPNWDMGAKISVDSATMMNKGLELIEAHYLFDIPEDRIDVLVHPQSIVHSMVSYVDGSVLAQLGMPDMRIPIAHTLGWPGRISAPSERLRLDRVAELTFRSPDLVRFPALGVARAALVSGAHQTVVLNAANEVAVEGFLSGATGFLDIVAIVEEALSRMTGRSVASLDDVMAADREARRRAAEIMETRARAGRRPDGVM